jgi:hypothetical protein
LGVAVVSNESSRCSEILSAAVSMARVIPSGLLADVRTEIVSFGAGGKGIEHGIEAALGGKAPFLQGGLSAGYEEDPDE